MKKGIIIFFLFFILNSVCSAQTDHESLRQYASGILPEILSKIPYGQEEAYGFVSRNEFETVSVGQAFLYYILDNSELKTTNMWRVPLVVNNGYRALITIAIRDNGFAFCDFGARKLAEDIQGEETQTSDTDFLGILRLFDKRADFLITKNGGEWQFIPLLEAEEAMVSAGFDRKPEYSLNEIITFNISE